MRDLTEGGSAHTPAGTEGGTCPRCHGATTVAEYTGPGGGGRIVCCLACGRILSVETRETRAAPTGEPAWRWRSG